MKRKLISDLVAWKEKAGRKPMLLLGARQVGKTWLLQEFGARYYERVAYIRFDREPRMCEAFAQDYDMQRLRTAIEIHVGHKLEAGKTLLILDEIQECPAALTSLKYFCEELPQLHVAAAGSLLGLYEHHGTGFPVGKVNIYHLYPMNYLEFMEAMGQGMLVELLYKRDWEMIRLFADKFTEYLRYYYFVGGMPEAVESFSRLRDFSEVRSIPLDLLDSYKRDFSKHAPTTLLARLSLVWDSLPYQLSRENKKFLCSEVQKGMRMRELEMALQWLEDAGLTYKVARISKPSLPPNAYRENVFKLFHLDVGLLAAQAGLQADVILNGNRIFQEFKGALAEQFVQQELRSYFTATPYYWNSVNGQSEIDFLVQQNMEIVPIEVKAELNLTAKSLKFFCQKFGPKLAVRTSLAHYHTQTLTFAEPADSVTSRVDIPLYALSQFRDVCADVLQK